MWCVFVRSLNEIEETKKTFRNYLTFSDVHVQNLVITQDRWNQFVFKKKTWGNIHLESILSTSWKLESEGLCSCNVPLLCRKVTVFYSKHISNLMFMREQKWSSLWKTYVLCYERMINDKMMLWVLVTFTNWSRYLVVDNQRFIISNFQLQMEHGAWTPISLYYSK